MEWWPCVFIVRLPLFSLLSPMNMNFFYIGKKLACFVKSGALLNPFSVCPRGSKVETMGGMTDGNEDIGSQGCHGNCITSFPSSVMSFCCYFYAYLLQNTLCFEHYLLIIYLLLLVSHRCNCLLELPDLI